MAKENYYITNNKSSLPAALSIIIVISLAVVMIVMIAFGDDVGLETDESISEIATGDILTENTNLTGLENMGNTCFFNASMQAMLSMTKLVKFLTESEFDLKKQPICMSLQNFLKACENRKKMRPQELVEILKKRINLFDGQQQDAREFIDFLFSIISEEYKTMNEEKINYLDEMLNYKIDQTLKCQVCGWESHQKSTSIILEIMPTESIQAEINSMSDAEKVKPEVITSFCENCKKNQKKEKRDLISNPSDYLMLYLKRHKEVLDKENKKVIVKDKTVVTIEDQIVVNNQVFELESVICHQGNYGAGHYYSYCKRDGKWYCFNDDQVTQSKIPTRGTQPYILTYSKKLNTDANAVEKANSDSLEPSQVAKTAPA